jgi:hypothetical protein
VSEAAVVESGRPARRSHGRRAEALALALLALVVYANAAVNGFVLDDRAILLEHPVVQDPAQFWRAFVSPYWPESIGGGQYRPLGLISFGLDRALAGSSALWYHAVNMGWHAATTLLLWRFAMRYIAPVGAMFAAAVFAVHPVHVEAVANVVGRLELMAAAFVLAGLLAHARRSWTAVLFYACACLSKEHAIVFLPLALASHVVLDEHPGDEIRSRARLWIGYLIVTVIWLGGMWFATRSHPPTVSSVFSGLGAGDRLLTVVSIVPEYFRLLLLPIHLSADYEPGVLTAVTQLDHRVGLGVAVLVLWAWATVRAWRAQRVVAYGLVFVPVALAPVSNVLFPTGIALAERALYLPSVGVCLAAGWMFVRLRLRHRTAVTAVGLSLLALGAVRTWSRTPVWHDSRTFALQLLADHPESYRAHWVAARVLHAAGNVDGARREYAIALRINAGVAALNREALALGVSGDSADRR